MKKNIGRILMLAAVLALIGAMVVSASAFAAGPDTSAQRQNGYGYGPGDGTGPGTYPGEYGPGPYCIDADGDGVCDCQS